MNLTRRSLLGMAAAAPLAMAAPAPTVKLGIDLFSLRSQNWTPFQLLDYSAKLAAKVVHFSEIRFIGNLEPENLRSVRRYAEERFDRDAVLKQFEQDLTACVKGV